MKEFKNYFCCSKCWNAPEECTCETEANWMTYVNPKTQTIEYNSNADNILTPYTKDKIVSMRIEQVKELISDLLIKKYVW